MPDFTHDLAALDLCPGLYAGGNVFGDLAVPDNIRPVVDLDRPNRGMRVKWRHPQNLAVRDSENLCSDWRI
jgi:hypothetical protein